MWRASFSAGPNHIMKAPLLPFTTFVSIFALVAGTALDMAAQDVRRGQASPPVNRNASAPDLARGVYLASIDAEDRSLRRYAGQTLFNTEGAELGAVRDFIVHPPTSQIRYVVVSSGGVFGGIGNSLRLVPVESLRHSERGRTFEVDILQADWLQVPPISDELYVIDRFEISAAQHQQMARRFGAGRAVAQPAAPVDRGIETGLIRASTLRGRAVNAVDRKVGDIENVIVDLDRGTAAALLDSSGGFTGTTAKYLVPLSGLTLQPRRDAIETTLTRADFDRAVPANFGRTAPLAREAAPVVDEPPLAPTGRTETLAAPRRPLTANTPAVDAGAASAHAVRQAIDHDPALAGERVQVMSENGRIILTGTVRSQILKENLDSVARAALPGTRIENRVTVVTR